MIFYSITNHRRVAHMKLPHRRQFLHLAAGAAALPAVSQVALAQAYPTRSVTMIVPFAAGGPSDVAARVVGEHMSRTLGQQFVVENVVGAGGTVGSLRTMRANPDGYTIQMGHMGTHAISVSLYPNLAYKPDADFEPIGIVVEQPILIAARKDFPAKDINEFVAYVKANAEKLNMAHTGVGSVSFSYALVLNSALGVKPTMVPYGGNAPAMAALLGGQVDYFMATILDVGSHYGPGTVKVYAIGSDERHPALPNVPTTKEVGLPNLNAAAWYALFAPKGTPRPVLDRLTDALNQALDDQNTRRRLLELGGNVPDKAKRGQHALAVLVKSDIARWTPIIKAANLKAE
jgi:tripartite-type tricarboxylate transporter receptor subunit TctC